MKSEGYSISATTHCLMLLIKIHSKHLRYHFRYSFNGLLDHCFFLSHLFLKCWRFLSQSFDIQCIYMMSRKIFVTVVWMMLESNYNVEWFRYKNMKVWERTWIKSWMEEFIIKFQFSITTTNVLSLFPLLFHFRVHQPQSVMQINFGALCRLQRFFVFALQKKQRANLIAWECISSIFFFHFFVFFSSSLNRT